MKKKMETSKKITLFISICFAIVLLFSMLAFGYESYTGNQSDSTLLVALVTVSGTAFGTTCAFYYNKAKGENLFKLKRSFLEYKYSLLKDMDLLDVESEISEEVAKIESDFNEEEDLVNQEITYNE